MALNWNETELEQLKELIGTLLEEKLQERDKIVSIGRLDLNELKNVVMDLAVVQKRTEERLDILTETVQELAGSVQELAVAQKRTEERLAGCIDDQQQHRSEEAGANGRRYIDPRRSM